MCLPNPARRYIEQYGFYEGGDANEYRIDPVLLAAFLQGQVSDQAVEVARRRGYASLAPLENEVLELEKQRGIVKPADAPFLEEAVGQARQRVQEERRLLDERLEKLRTAI